MFNDPEWASQEEWDAYAWFGFAVSEAQMLEGQLLVIATALEISKGAAAGGEDAWSAVYDSLGRLTLGQLLGKVRPCAALDSDLIESLRAAVQSRNQLAHEFFWGKNPRDAGDRSPLVAQDALREAASLFRNTAERLDQVVEQVLEKLHVESSEARAQARKAIN